MGSEPNSASFDAGKTQEKGIGQPLSWTRSRTRGPTDRKRERTGSASALGTDLRLTLDVIASVASAGSVRELAFAISGPLHPLLPYDVGCIRWAPVDQEDDEWAIEASGEDLTESLAFDHLGNLIEEWEGRDPTLDLGSETGGPDDERMSDLYRFRAVNGDLVCMRARSVAVVPLNAGERSVGVLVLISSRSNAFPNEAVEGLKELWSVTAFKLKDILDKEALTSDRDRARSLLDSSEDLHAIWRYDGSVWEVDCNRRIEELMERVGMTPDRMDGPFFIPPGPDLERTEFAWRRAFHNREHAQLDVRLPDAAGRMKDFILEFSPLPSDGTRTGVVMTGRDMDRIAEGICSVEDDNRVNRKLMNVMTDRLKDPICAIMGYCELLSVSPGMAPEQARTIEGIVRMTSRINDTLDLANLLCRLRDRKVELELERKDISRMVQGCLERLRPEVQRYDVVFQRKDSAIEATCSVLIERVMLTLMENAMRYSEPGSRIVLDLSTDIDGMTFSVADEGEGVPDIYKRTIFERFDGATIDDGVQGSGLGLSVCKRIIGLHKGRIWAEDNKPKGSVFKFFLPWDPEA